MPLDRGIIDHQLQALGESPRWWEHREMRDLPSVLLADERILAIARGKLGFVRLMRRAWLIVVTDRRIVCLRVAGRQAWRQLEIAAPLLSRVSLRIGPFRGRVVVIAGGHTWRLLVPRAVAYRLTSAISSLVSPARESIPSFRPGLMVRRVIDHVLALPAVALNPEPPRQPKPLPPANPSDEQVRALEDQLDELRQQVDFLEQLLHQQHADPVLGRPRSE